LINKIKTGVSVVIPAYNEETNIYQTMKSVLDAMNQNFEDFEIIIVDDCSTDKTGKISDEMASANNKIKVIHNKYNLGQGGSLSVGFANVSKDLTLHNAMDYPFDMHDLPEMVDLANRYDIVVAARKSRPGYTLYRHILSRVNLFLLNILFDLHLSDYSFIQVYHSDILRKINPSSKSTGFFIPELLIRAYKKGYLVHQVPIKYLPRNSGIARSGSMKVVYRSSIDLIKFWCNS
jgi:glycosyltransferase involved in cell wall biosynthesis